jgi:hypothetical protein
MKKMKQNKQIITILILVCMISPLAFLNGNLIDKKTNENQINNEKPESGAVDPSKAEFTYISQKQTRGSSVVETEFGFTIAGTDILYSGEYIISVIAIGNFGRCTSIYNGIRLDTISTSAAYFPITSCHTTAYGTTFMYTTHSCYASNYYLVPDYRVASSTPLIYYTISTCIPTLDIDYMRTSSGGTTYLFFTSYDGTDNIRMYCSFEPVFVINSTIFTEQNTILSIYDKFSLAWTNFTTNTVVLNHPQYKARLYDRLSNRVIYEDSSYVNVTFQRTLTPTSDLTLVNNSPELVKFRFMNQYKDFPIAEVPPANSSSLLPNGDSGTMQFAINPTSPTTHYDKIDDNAVTSDYIYSSTYNYVDSFTMTTETLPARFIVTKIYVLVYGQAVGSTIGGSVNAIYNLGGGDSALEYFNAPFPIPSAAWRYVLWSGLSISSQSQIDDLIIRLKMNVWLDGVFRCYSMKTILTYYIPSVSGNLTTSYSDALYKTSENVIPYSTEPYDKSFVSTTYPAYYYDVVDTYGNTLKSFRELTIPDIDYSFTSSLSDWIDADTTGGDSTYQNSVTLNSKMYDVLQLYDNDVGGISSRYKELTSSYDFFSFWLGISYSSATSSAVFYEGSTVISWIRFYGNVLYVRTVGGSETNIGTVTSNTWFHVAVQFTSHTTMKVWVNNVYKAEYTVESITTDITKLAFKTYEGDTGFYTYIAAPYIGNDFQSAFQAYTAYPCPRILTYTPPNIQSVFISIADNRGDYVDWENFKLTVDGTQIYDNVFLGELNEDYNISVYTRFDKYVTSQIITVNRTNNYVSFTITLHSLKIFNQQGEFAHINITFDPAYYISPQCWSEWIAPNEIIEFRLVSQHYLVNITEAETDSETIYEYPMYGDDMFLITSGNTIANAIYNIVNVGDNIEEQITDVEINIMTNNSDIGAQIVNVIINLNNTNSSIGDLLLYQQTSINFLWSNLSNFFSYCDYTYTFLNTTVAELLVSQTNSFEFANSTLLTLETYSLNSFVFLNTSIDNMGLWLGTNFTYLFSNISQNQIEVNTNFAFVTSNITNSSMFIRTNILAINSSISQLLLDLQSNVLLVNDTIYSVVANLSINLALDSSTILGNISLTYEQNEFLTDLFKQTMFSELLNWSGVGYNYSLIKDQIQMLQFTNAYRNESVEILLKYLNLTQSLYLSSQTMLTQYLPASGVKYRIRSLATGEYLTTWESVGENKNITIGFYDEIVPATPEQVRLAITDYLLIALFGVVIAAVVSILYIKTKAELDAPTVKKGIDTGLDQIGVRDTSHLYFSERNLKVLNKKKPTSPLIIIMAVIVVVFVGVYLVVNSMGG